MSYFIFDMDETLAELYSVYYFIASLRLQQTISEYNRGLFLNKKFHNSLIKAYDLFLAKVLEEETSSKPLGILRPGILGVMKELDKLRKQGLIHHVVIYSNNGHLGSLEFIRDLIHLHLGNNKLVGDCIHLDHPMRKAERVGRSSNKTWDVLRAIIMEGPCGGPRNLEVNRVFFFDDLLHGDLKKNLGDNYFRVPAYDFKASVDRLALIYKEAIMEAGVDLEEFNREVGYIFMKGKGGDLDDIIATFKERTGGTENEYDLPPNVGDDLGIQMMMDATRRVSSMIRGGKKRGFSCAFRMTQSKRKHKKRHVGQKTLRKN